MKNIKIEFKWAIIFTIMTLLWMVLEKLCGLHGAITPLIISGRFKNKFILCNAPNDAP